jgi:hypothetical protein
MIRAVKCLMIVTGLFVIIPQIHAFQLKSDVLSSGGTWAVSTSFIGECTLSQLTASNPWLTSAGYKAIIGFWHPFSTGPGIEERFENLSPPAYINFLYPNSPNPTLGHTTIQYSIAKEGSVILEVYNILGQCVASLVDGKQMPGVYQVIWTLQEDRLPAGVYFYRLKTAEYTKVRKMVVIH